MIDTTTPPNWQIQVFFDGACPLCSREISMLSRLDSKRRRIWFTDIAAAEFSAGDYGMTQDDLMAEIRGRLPDGRIVTGVEVFRRLYGSVGLAPLIPLTRLPVIAWLLDRAYSVFAKNRLRWTGRCDATCAIGDGSPDRKKRSLAPYFRVGIVLLAVLGACTFPRAPTPDRARAMIAGQTRLAPADVIIVHGCPAWPDGSPSTCNKRRAEAAVAAYNQGLASRVIFTGGATLNRYAESRVMAAHAITLGLPSTAVIIEDESRHTVTNLSVARGIMRENGWQTAILVSESMHLVWAKQLAEFYSIPATLYPSDMLPPYTNAYVRSASFDALEPWRTQTTAYGTPKAAATSTSVAAARRIACIIVGPDAAAATSASEALANEPGYEVQVYEWSARRNHGSQARALAGWIESWVGGWNGHVDEVRIVSLIGGEAVASLAADAYRERGVPVTVASR